MNESFLAKYRQPLQLWWLWFASACALVLLVCVMSLVNLSEANIPVSDKTLHFVAYWSICIWWLQIFRGRWVGGVIVAAAICLGVGLEIAQSFHPMRHMDYRDAIANSVGAGLGYLCAVLGLRKALLWLETHVLKLLKR
jgi:VanZ family protein